MKLIDFSSAHSFSPEKAGYSLIPGGECFVGSNWARGNPVRRVNVDSFYVQQHPVTHQLYQEFLNECPSLGVLGRRRVERDGLSYFEKKQGVDVVKNHPRTNIKLNGARFFAEWWSHKTGVYHRLPTPAEWEVMARGPIIEVGEVLERFPHVPFYQIVGQYVENLFVYEAAGKKRLLDDMEETYDLLMQRKPVYGSSVYGTASGSLSMQEANFGASSKLFLYSVVVYSMFYPPNGFGVYGATGQVKEWVDARNGWAELRGGSFISPCLGTLRAAAVQRVSGMTESTSLDVGLRLVVPLNF